MNVYTTLPACAAAARQLQDQPEIAIDLEGVSLCRSGVLSLIQIADPDSVHIFDITQLGAAAFEEGGLRALLEGPNLKVIFDGRADNDALFHLHKVTMKNMLDLQVFHAFKFSEDSDLFVKGLDRCLSDGAPLPGMNISEMKTVKEKGKRLFAADHGASNYEIWEVRPLHLDLLEYAGNDVKHLLPLKNKWLTSAVSTLDMRPGSILIPGVKAATALRIGAAISGTQKASGAHMARRDFELPRGPSRGVKRSRDEDSEDRRINEYFNNFDSEPPEPGDFDYVVSDAGDLDW